MKTSSTTDRRFLRRTLELARLGAGLTLKYMRRSYVADDYTAVDPVFSNGYSKAALAAGCEERMVALAESQGLAVVAVLARVFDRLGLTAEQRQLAASVVPEELRAQSVT